MSYQIWAKDHRQTHGDKVVQAVDSRGNPLLQDVRLIDTRVENWERMAGGKPPLIKRLVHGGFYKLHDLGDIPELQALAAFEIVLGDRKEWHTPQDLAGKPKLRTPRPGEF